MLRTPGHFRASQLHFCFLLLFLPVFGASERRLRFFLHFLFLRGVVLLDILHRVLLRLGERLVRLLFRVLRPCDSRLSRSAAGGLRERSS